MDDLNKTAEDDDKDLRKKVSFPNRFPLSRFDNLILKVYRTLIIQPKHALLYEKLSEYNIFR